jgi:nicotinate-nucleotide pyrophosphorylase (carboxylating)
MAEAVGVVGGRALTMASGGVNLGNLAAVAATGVDLVAIGALTHSAPAADLGMNYLEHQAV